MTFRKILVALESSRSSKYVFEKALDLAAVQSSQLIIFHCFTTTHGETIVPMQAQLGISPNLTVDTFQAQRQGQEKRREEVLAFLNDCCDGATSQGITAEVEHQNGEPGSSICQAASKWGVDLIIMGRRGRTGVAEALLGSASNYVMHHAACSVLVIQNNNSRLSEPGS